MRAFLLLLAVLLGSALPAGALTLDLPVRYPGRATAVPAPAYRGDLIEIRLAPAVTRAAAARSTGRGRVEVLGVSRVDRLAAQLGGVWFEPEFRGETLPSEGSDEPDFTAFYLGHLPAGVSLEDALVAFRALGEVASAHPIAILPVDAFPNDSLWTNSHWFYQPATRRDIHAPEAWDVTIGDTAIVVAVLDTGVVPYHPDIGGVVSGLPGQIWTNWNEAAGTPGVDDDVPPNGYVDDIHGWDFVTGAPDGLLGEDADDEDNDPNDYAGHGTAVASLIGALTNNGIGIAGTAWRVRLMPLRMGWASTFSASGEVQMDFAARAIRYATRMGATVINCSWASANTDGIDAAVAAAVRAGITVVSAAGNLSPFHYLGDRDDVLAIASTDSNDVVAAFSNTGAFVDLAAPGDNMRAAWIARPGTDSLGLRQPTYVALLDGTSFSAPLVSGVAALIQSRYLSPYAQHLLTPRGVQLRLMETADDIAAQNPSLLGLYGAGRLNAARALTEITGSTATRTRARSAGGSVLVPAAGGPRVAFLTTNRRLIQIDAAAQDTVMNQDTFGAPSGHLAAADLGGGLSALFYATFDSGVYGVDASNAPLPGNWPQPGSAPSAMNGPALGDVDGDGTIEVVSGGADGQLWVWHADGSDAAGFPITTGASPLQAPALSDLDGVPGVEVIVVAQDGTVHVYRSGGVELPGWPQTVVGFPRAPVITRLGSNRSPSVIIAAGNQLHAFDPAGVERAGFPVTLGGTTNQDPVVGDLDGDGSDEIVVTTFPPSLIEVRDSSGVSLASLGWPRTLNSSATSPPVLGELSTTSPGPELLIRSGGALLALERDGDPLATFPKPGGAGVSLSLVQADGDPNAEVLAGTGSDSLYYIYDAGPGSLGVGPMPWPTERANFARTGSRLYAPALGAPARVADLRVAARTDTSISLVWTATGDDGAAGRPQSYAVHAALQPLSEASFASAPHQRVVPATVDAGGTETFVFTGLTAATVYWFGLKAEDDENNVSLLSNGVSAQTEVGGPLTGRDGIALAVLEQPSRGGALFYWQAAPDGASGSQRIHIYDVRGRQIRVLDVGGGDGGTMNWDGRDAEGRSVPAGLYYARLLSGSFHAQTRLVLLP